MIRLAQRLKYGKENSQVSNYSLAGNPQQYPDIQWTIDLNNPLYMLVQNIYQLH